MGTSLSRQLLQPPLGQLASTSAAPPLIGQTKELPSGISLQNGKNSQLRRIAQKHHEHRAHIRDDHADPSPHTMILMNHTKRKTMSKFRGLRQENTRKNHPGRHHRLISKKTCSTTNHLPRTMKIACRLPCQHSPLSTKSQSRTHHALPQACRHNNPHDLQDQVPFHLIL